MIKMVSHLIYFIKYITDTDLKEGFFNFPNELIDVYLDSCKITGSNKVQCYLGDDPHVKTLVYDNYGRLYIGKNTLIKWFPTTVVKHRRFIKIERLTINCLKITPLVEPNKMENLIKGIIGELGIFQLIYSCGMGYIHCYKPVLDMEGIDLIINLQHKRTPIYLQVKCGLDPSGRLWHYISPKVYNFHPSDNFFIVLLHFDLTNLDFYDYIYIIPSKKLHLIAKIKNEKYEFNYNIKNPSNLPKYRKKKTELLSFLFEQFRKLEGS